MKTIGIILRDWEMPYEDRIIDIYGVGRDVIKFLRKYDNVSAVCMPAKSEKRIINACDGIIFPGGDGRNQSDYELMRYLYEIDKPTLGICLGMQIMGVAFNGKVEEEAVRETHYIMEKYVHKIKIKEDSKLYKILGKTEIKVNSRHRDRVTTTELECVAKSEDGIIEAIEDKNKRFFEGVQWHPESIFDDEYSNKLFDYFINTL